MIEVLLKKIADYFNFPIINNSVVSSTLYFCILTALLILVVLMLVLFERKLLAKFTLRYGPNRVGPFGILQTCADAIKLLFKEDIISSSADKIIFILAPIIFFVPSMILYGLIPFCEKFVAINIPLGLFLFFVVSSFCSVGLLLAGYASNNKYTLIGGIRAVVQAISYELPLMLVVISIVVLSESMNLIDITLLQTTHKGLFSWYFIPNILGLFVFYNCILIKLNRAPYDLPEAENELVGGYNTEYSGMKFAMFFLGEYANFFISSMLLVVLFFGGFSSPFGVYISELIFKNTPWLNYIIQLEEVFWVFFKTFLVIFLSIWIRATLPRIKSDSIIKFCFKFLLPLALINLFVIVLLKFLV